MVRIRDSGCVDHNGTSRRPRVYTLTILPLAGAAEAGNQAVAEKLRSIMALKSPIAAGDPDNFDHTVLFLTCAACGWEDLLRILLKRGCRPNMVSPTMVFEVLRHEDPGQDTRYENPSALYLAAQRGHLAVVESLLQNNVGRPGKLKATGLSSALALAILAGNIRVVRTLLGYGANPDYQRKYCNAFICSALRIPEILELLLDRGAGSFVTRAWDGLNLISRVLR